MEIHNQASAESEFCLCDLVHHHVGNAQCSQLGPNIPEALLFFTSGIRTNRQCFPHHSQVYATYEEYLSAPNMGCMQPKNVKAGAGVHANIKPASLVYWLDSVSDIGSETCSDTYQFSQPKDPQDILMLGKQAPISLTRAILWWRPSPYTCVCGFSRICLVLARECVRR